MCRQLWGSRSDSSWATPHEKSSVGAVAGPLQALVPKAAGGDAALTSCGWEPSLGPGSFSLVPPSGQHRCGGMKPPGQAQTSTGVTLLVSLAGPALPATAPGCQRPARSQPGCNRCPQGAPVPWRPQHSCTATLHPQPSVPRPPPRPRSACESTASARGMEPVADGGGEKSFSYVLRAPSGDGFDAVSVQIHTCWVFQDEEDSGQERGRLPEGALPGKQPQPSEQKPRAAAGGDVECRLRSRIRELELSERRLRGELERLGGRVARERSAALRAQEELAAQPPAAEPGLDEQILVLVCGCPSAQGQDGSLHPMDLTWISEHLPAAPAPQPSVLVPTATLPPWGSAEDPAPLPPPLLLRPPREEVLAAGLPPAAEAARHPGWDCPRAKSRDSPLCQESPHTSDHPLPTKAPRDPRDAWHEEGGVRKTVGREEAALGSKCWPGQESRETVTLGSGLRAPEGMQGKSEAAVSQPQPECPLPLLQGEVPVSLEGPESLGRKGGEDGGGGVLQGGLSLEEAAPLPTCTGAHRPAGRDRVARSSGQHEEPLTLGDALLRQEEHPGREEEEKEQMVSHQEVWGSADRGVPQQADSEGYEGMVTLAVGEPGSPLCPGSAVSTDGGHVWAPSRGDRFSVDIDELEQAMEECLQQLFLLRPDGGARGRGTPPSSRGNRRVAGQGADSPQVFGNQRWEVCSAEATEPQAGGEDVQQGQAKVPGPRPVPGWEEASPGPPEGPSGLGELRPSPPWRALERLRLRLHQLLCGLERDGSQVVHGNAKLQGEQDRCHEKVRALERARAREAAEAARLARANRALLGDAERWKRELDQCLQVISELEDGNERSYGKILELEEENAQLKGSLGVMQRAALENRELKALVAELGAGYKELTEELALGFERVTQALQSEHAHLLRRVCVLETDVASQRNPDRRRSVGGGEPLPGESQMAEGWVCAVDKEVQATPPSGQPVTGVLGPPAEEEADPVAGPAGSSSDVENSRSAVGCTAVIPSCGLQGSPYAAGDEGVQEETRAVCSVDPGQALRWPSHGLQLVELQRERREVDLAVPPLKAKLASLVRKCRERNRVIAHLLRELHARGPEDRALSQLAQSVQDDAALAQYSAAFLAPGSPETSHRLDVPSAETAAGRAQKALWTPDVDGALPSPSCSGAWPVPEAQGPAPAAPPDSPQPPVPTRPPPDPRMSLAAVAVDPTFPAQHLQERGGLPGPGLPPASELLSPARILAFHRALGQSICRRAWVDSSPLEREASTWSGNAFQPCLPARSEADPGWRLPWGAKFPAECPCSGSSPSRRRLFTA
ncbi:uncharacterized protein C4orf50 homolog isoform X2 [Oryctolagus cuniculus]|uniref:uncharacterized protein C4orf50 homolog isoform X2 n=1 Tax=Oryctolagus cuniculus TaxID=9986 RepID=UPI00387A7591